MSYFMDSETGYLFPGFRTILGMRMQEVGIYSINDLGRRMNVSNSAKANISARIKSLDAQATKDNQQLREFRQKQDE